MDYLSFWKMRQPPFELHSEAAFFYESEEHGEALARLLYLVSDQGMGIGAMAGEIGSGKTMLLNVLTGRLRQDLYKTVRLHTAHLPFEDILAEINQQIASAPVNPAVGRYELLKTFEQLLKTQIEARGKHLVIILDESQFLSPETLDALKCLTNYNQTSQLLTLIMVGQPELREKLRALPQIYQRLGMFCFLQNLKQHEIAPYLKHRLTIAGAEDPHVFEEACIQPLYDFSQGCPRQINRVFKLAVDRACLLQKKKIDTQMIQLIIQDIHSHFG